MSMSFVELLTGPQKSAATVPARVQAAMSFVAMMRSTAAHPAYDGGPQVETTPTGPERATYESALELTRHYFAGEMYPDEREADRPPDPPPATETVLNPEPSPSPLPTPKSPLVPAEVVS